MTFAVFLAGSGFPFVLNYAHLGVGAFLCRRTRRPAILPCRVSGCAQCSGAGDLHVFDENAPAPAHQKRTAAKAAVPEHPAHCTGAFRLPVQPGRRPISYSSSSSSFWAFSMIFLAASMGISSYRSKVMVKEPRACVMERRSVAYLNISPMGASAVTRCRPST